MRPPRRGGMFIEMAHLPMFLRIEKQQKAQVYKHCAPPALSTADHGRPELTFAAKHSS
jgi:hypothetical protein